MTLEKIFKAVIAKDIQKDLVNYSYAKNLVGACIISIFASPIYAALYYFLNDYSSAIVILFTEFILLLALLLIKYSKLIYANIIFVTSLTFLLAWLTVHLGGLYSTTAYWLVLPALIAAFVGGIRFAYAWCSINIVVIACIYLLEYFHYAFPATTISNRLFLQFTGICGLAIIIVALIYFYELAKKDNLEKLKYIAYHDELTHLPNQYAYAEILEKTLKAAYKFNRKFALIYIDIDQFNKVNTIFGRETGDILLFNVAKRIKQYIRHTDIMARVGSDEFKIIIDIIPGIETIKELAEIIFIAVKLPYHIKNDEISITASMGLIIYPNPYVPEHLVNRYVEFALEKAKAAGGNYLQHYTDVLAQEAALAAQIERQLPTAIKNNELNLYFQPQFEINPPNKIMGLEALLRWKNDEIGEIPPSIFIPIAERMGIIGQLGEWVLKAACIQYIDWVDKGIINSNIILSVNVSAHQLYSETFLDYIVQILTQTHISPQSLSLEITETAIITDLDRALLVLENLAKFGIRIVIDDFGVGYTSLSYFDKLPISTIKIDKSFTDNIIINKTRANLVKSIIDLAHSINLNVVAEGVETEKQLQCLKNLNCDFIQGYFLGKPENVSVTEAFLVNKKRKNE